MPISIAHSVTPANVPHFKKRPLAQLITLTLSLAGYGTINNRAYAIDNSLGCDVSTATEIENATINEGPCTIEALDGSVRIINSSLSNTNTGELTNNGGLFNDGFFGTSTLSNNGILTNNGYLDNVSYNGSSTLSNSGTLNNSSTQNFAEGEPESYGGLYNYSYGEGSTSTLTNTVSGSIENTGFMVNDSRYGGSSNLDNSGSLTNSGIIIYDDEENSVSYGGLINSSYEQGSTSTLTNAAGATLDNTGLIGNDSAYGGTSNLTNAGVLTNSGTATYDNEDNLLSYGGLVNSSYDQGSTSTLTNAAGASLTNTGDLINDSHYGGTSKLKNEAGAMLTNDGYLGNYSSQGSTSTLSNSGTLTNNGFIDNNADITNSGTFDITTDGDLYNSGTFTQTAGRTTVNGTIGGTGTVDIQGGSLSGEGIIEADSITIGENATVKPGNSPGTLIMISDVQMYGTLQTEIVSSSVYDMLAVDGTVSLSGTSYFEFLFDASYMGVDGDSFDFLSAFDFDFGFSADFFDWSDPSHFNVEGLDGAFDWSVSFTDNVSDQSPSYLSLNIFDNGPVSNAVSAPGTLALFGLALSIMGWGSRRRVKPRALNA